MKWPHALPIVLTIVVSIALVLYYVFSGDIRWYGWFTIAASIATLSYTAASFFKSREEKKRERDYRRGRMRMSIREAEAVFRDMSALSNDYDFMDEDSASRRIAAHAKRNAEKIRRCENEIREEMRHLGGKDAVAGEAGGVVDDLRWFGAFYSCDGQEPSVAQRVAWNDDRSEIGGHLDRLSRASKMLAGA